MKINIGELFLLFLKKKRVTFTIIISFLILGVVLAFTLPKRYTAVAKLLPPSPQFPLGRIGNRQFTFLQGLEIPGLLPLLGSVDLYGDILRSYTIKNEVVESCSLVQKLNLKSKKEAFELLSKSTKLRLNEVGVFSIEVEHSLPEVTALIANGYVYALDKFLREKNMTQGKNLRIFVEKRLEEVKEKLAEERDSLTAFQKKYRIPAIGAGESEGRVALSLIELKTEAIKKGLELEYLKEFSTSRNPRREILERELELLNRKLATMPEITSEYLKRYIEYRILEETYLFIKQQYEQARIMEVKDTPVLSVLEYALPPKSPSFPKKKILIAAFFFAGLAVSIFYTSFAVFWEKIKSNPKDHTKLLEIIEEIKGIAKLKKK